jgi:hypothetical protein
MRDLASCEGSNERFLNSNIEQFLLSRQENQPNADDEHLERRRGRQI